MSGYSTARGFSSARDMSKRQGVILRGYGPPVPQAGVAGDLYIDVLTWRFFEKREIDGLDAWGHYLFAIPSLYRTALKWFGDSAPSNEIGVAGDYFLQWAGFDNYGMQPQIWGPKLWTGWPENGDGPGTIVVGDGTILPIGLDDEGTSLDDMALSQLLAIGLLAEYVIPVPVTANPGDPILELGLQSSGQLVTVALNNLYTAQDELQLVGPSSDASGVFTINTAGVKTTAQLLALAGLTSSFTTISITVNTAPAGVSIAQGAGSVIYAQGDVATFSNVSVANTPVTLTLATGDVVSVLYSGA